MSDKTAVVAITVPGHLVGRPVSEIKRVLMHPKNNVIDVIAAEVHRCINNPDFSLPMMIASLDAERKRIERESGHGIL